MQVVYFKIFAKTLHAAFIYLQILINHALTEANKNMQCVINKLFFEKFI